MNIFDDYEISKLCNKFTQQLFDKTSLVISKKQIWHDLYAILGSIQAYVKNANLCLLANYVITPKTKVIYCPPMGIIRRGQKGFCINKELLIIVSLS